MKDPKAIRKAIMTARNIAAMVDPNFARVPLPQVGEPDYEEMRKPLQFSMGGRLPARRSDNPFEQFQSHDPFSFDLPDHTYAAGGVIAGRSPDLQEYAQNISTPDFDQEHYHNLIDQHKPVTPYESVPAPATEEDMLRGLTTNKHHKINAVDEYQEGHPVGLRLDIPAYTKHGVWVPTMHDLLQGGRAFSHQGAAHITDATFDMPESQAVAVAKGRAKSPFAHIDGRLKKTSVDDIHEMAKDALDSPEWVQVGMDPERHSYFYDRSNHRKPIHMAEEVLQVGPLVLAKNPVFGDPKDHAYAAGGDVEAYQDPETQHISDWNWRPVEDVQESLGGLKEIPSHVEKFGDFMDNIAQRAGSSGLTPRDLIKAYTITRSSIQRQAADVNKLRASGLDLPEEMTGKIRPEGAFGEWLHTPAGQAYLDAAEKGNIHQAAIEDAIKVMAPFGRHQTDIPDALTWAALNLPGKEKQVSELVHAGHLMASTPEEWRAFTQHIRGVGPSKSGFLASLMGRGDQPTLDARQIILHTGRPTKEASKYIAKKGGAGGVEAVDRLAARQSAMDLSLPEHLKPYYQHLTHHAVWDKAGNDETTHEDVVRAMHHAANGGAQGDGDEDGILSHPVAKIFQTIGMAGLNDSSVDPEKFKEYLQRAQHALARKITIKGSDVLASYPDAGNVKMSKFGKPLEEMESTIIKKGFMLPSKEADLEEMQRRGSRIFPFLGDLSPADQVLLKSGQTDLTDPSEQQGGAGFMRSEFAQGRDPAAYGNRVGAAKTLAKKIASQTPEGTPAIGTHVAMGLGSVDSSHHAYEPILRMIPHSPIQQKHIDEFDDMMREALPPSKKYPMAWPGIMNTEEAEQFFAGRPGTHASFFAKKIDSSKWQKAGFPDIGEVRFSASTPELLGAPRLSTGSAFSQVEPSGRIVTNPDLKHKTYPALIPSKDEGYMGGSSVPIPAKLMFSDFFKTLKTKDKSGKAIDYDSPAGQTLFQQSLMTKVPYQDATQEWLDNIMEHRRQKQERGFKKGGKVRSALMIAKGLKKG